MNSGGSAGATPGSTTNLKASFSERAFSYFKRGVPKFSLLPATQNKNLRYLTYTAADSVQELSEQLNKAPLGGSGGIGGPSSENLRNSVSGG